MFKRILLAVDLAHLGSHHRAVVTAAGMARQDSAELRVLTVIPDFGISIVGSFFPSGFEEWAVGKARRELRAFADREIGADFVVDHLVRTVRSIGRSSALPTRPIPI